MISGTLFTTCSGTALALDQTESALARQSLYPRAQTAQNVVSDELNEDIAIQVSHPNTSSQGTSVKRQGV